MDMYEYNACVLHSSRGDAVEDDAVVRVRGLQFQATDLDVARFFKGLNIAR